jgi:hypothetical protein
LKLVKGKVFRMKSLFFILIFIFFSYSVHSMPKVEFGGLIEGEASYGDEFSGVYSSDLTAATVELSAGLRVNEKWSGDIIYLFEDPDTALRVEEGYIKYGDMDKDQFAMIAGIKYLPFGRFETIFISDPLTLDTAEIREAAIVGASNLGPINLGIFLFNGNADKSTKSNHIYGYGLWVKYEYESEALNLHASTSLISNLGDSDTIQDVLPDTNGDGTKNDQIKLIPAQNIALGLTIQDFTLNVEYLWSYGGFDSTDIAWNSGKAGPTAYQVELSYAFGAYTFGVGYQATDEAFALSLAKSRIILGGSYEINENVSFSGELNFEKDYDTNECTTGTSCGTGKSKKTLTLQLALGI